MAQLGQLQGFIIVFSNTMEPNVIARSLGVFASVFKPWVMHCCTGNGARGLYCAWEGTVREKGDTAQVNFLLNRVSKLLDVN